MRKYLPILFVLLVTGCAENAVEPVKGKDYSGKWRYEYLTYEYNGYGETVWQTLTLNKCTTGYCGFVVYLNDTLDVLSTDEIGGFRIHAGNLKAQVHFYLDDTDAPSGRVEFLKFSATYWYSVGVFSVWLIREQ